MHALATAVMGEKVPGVTPGFVHHLTQLFLLLEPMRINSTADCVTGLIRILGGSFRLCGLALLLLLELVLPDELLKGLWR